MTDEGLGLSDEHLVGRCRAGDQVAWSALMRRHSGLLYRLALRSVRRTDEAEDLVQEVLWKVSRMLSRFDDSMAFKPWLLQVARNHLIDHHRSLRRERGSTIELDALPVEPGSRPASQDHGVLTRERAEALREGLERLPASLRQAVVLRDVDGLEYQEIATALAVPLGTVKSRINRGRVQLAKELAHRREELS